MSLHPAQAVNALDALADLVAERVADKLAERAPASATAGYLDVVGAAAYLSRPKSRIYDLVAGGELRAHREGRTLLFRREDLDAVLVVDQPEATVRDYLRAA